MTIEIIWGNEQAAKRPIEGCEKWILPQKTVIEYGPICWISDEAKQWLERFEEFISNDMAVRRIIKFRNNHDLYPFYAIDYTDEGIAK